MHPSDTLVMEAESSRAESSSQPQNPSACPPLGSGTHSSLQQYLRVLRKRRWILLTCICASLLMALVISLRSTRMFQARSRLAILKETPLALGLKDSDSTSEEDWDYTVTLDTQSGILKSEALALQVIREMKLDQHPHFLKGASESDRESEPKTEALVLANFTKGLKISPVLHTRLLEISFVSPDPRLSTEIVNTLIRDYIEQNFKTRFESTMQKSDWLAKQLRDLQSKVEESQETLVKYQRAHNILGLDEKQNIVTSKLDELNKELTLAQAARIQKEATYRNALSSSPELSVEKKEHGIPDSLRTKYADLKQQYAKLTTEFGPAYPRVIELRNELDQVREEIESERAHIAKRLALEFETAVRREKMLTEALDAQKQEANRLNESAIQYNLLRRETEANRQLYDGLLQKLKEASVTAGLRSSNIRVVDPARVPVKPVSPNIPRSIAVSLILGTFLGVIAAFVTESLDNAIHTSEEVLQVASLPTLAVIPLDSSIVAQHDGEGRRIENRPPTPLALISHEQPHSPVTESYRSLRTSMLLSSAAARRKVWLVTSALPQEGKTSTAVNTSIVLAQNGARVLLVDADLRRPVIHNRFGVQPECGLSTLLAGGCEENQAIVQSDSVPNLHLLPAGPVPPQPAELLGSDEFARFITKWRRDFDHVVIDSSPILPVTDAVLLSATVDSVMLVIRAGSTTRDELRRAHEVLLQVHANLVGVVINAADLRGPEYRSYGKHYQYYAAHK